MVKTLTLLIITTIYYYLSLSITVSSGRQWQDIGVKIGKNWKCSGLGLGISLHKNQFTVQYLPITFDKNPKNSVPNNAPRGRKLAMSEACEEFIWKLKCDSSEKKSWSDGDSQPIEIPTLNAKIFAERKFFINFMQKFW